MGKKIRVRVIISGRVQGVFFRYSTKCKAQEKCLTGWVKNLYSGEVECLFEGDETRIKEMIEWCHKGPPGARIENVEVSRLTGESRYDIFRVCV
ncbi:MAG: acylphosphatase [Candidatus Omnitrophica bacterium]|nr:acylphosphatase [Candidatus Omnitrophota bacterium]